MVKIKNIVVNYWLLLSVITTGIAILVCRTLLPHNDIVWRTLLCLLLAVVVLTKLVEMIRDLRQGNVGIDILAVIAIVACLATGELLAAYIISLMLSSGEALEILASRRARRELSALIKRRPQIAHLVIGDTTNTVSLSEVKLKDVLLVKKNEVVPVDGLLLSNQAIMDESSLTGESLPATKKRGDKIISGTVCQSTAIKITATTTAKDSYYSQIIRLVEESDKRPSRFVNLANRYAIPFTVISLALAGLGWYLSGNPTRFAEVLVVASPCPLILAAPIAFVAGMGRCSQRGIIVKGGDALEQIAQADVFAFDKTGTLTTNKIVVDRIDTANNYSKKSILAIAAAIESASTHVLASSIVDCANQHQLKLPPAKSIRESTGGGMFATIDGRRIVLGSPSFLARSKITGLPTDIHNQTAVMVAVNGRYAGAIYFVNPIRHGAKNTLNNLRQSGVKGIILLTGDRPEVAKRVGDYLDINAVFSSLSPVGKVTVIDKYRDHGHQVVMVGDGINDAPVLTTANVGIAMGVMGSTVAGETADAVITGSQINRISELRHIAMRTLVIAWQSVLAGMILCLGLELIAVFGIIPAAIGALLQEVVDVVAITNALRALK